MRTAFVSHYPEIQKRQWKASLFVFTVLLLFYFIALGLITFACVASFGFLLFNISPFSKTAFLNLFLFTTVASLLVATFHFYDARKFGAAFIRKRLQAAPPDMSDRYHKRFVDTVEEIRIAAGLPKVNPFVLPSFAINSMALSETDNTPSILITEGLLAEFTRDEIQAVVSHELAHILRGDSFYLTLVCSLANFFERMRFSIEPEKPAFGPPNQDREGGAPPFVYVAVVLSSIIMHLLSTLVSRQREILADATAVELNRSPRALARAIYKAHRKNSFVGDFSLTYSPLFIVPPDSRDISESFFSRIFNSHPPLVKRIKLLADMIPLPLHAIVEEVWSIQKSRDLAKSFLTALEEKEPEKIMPSLQDSVEDPVDGKIWTVRSPQKKWEGPYTLEEILFLPFFSPYMRTRNLQEDIEAQAREFPQIRMAFINKRQRKPFDPTRLNRCPVCHSLLQQTYYEGISLQICPQCQGKLVDSTVINRIICRKEVGFSEKLQKKAQEFREQFMDNPSLVRKMSGGKKGFLFCPSCGMRMLPRPFNYHYTIPVEKCLSCHKIWFDADELEMLQILIEKR